MKLTKGKINRLYKKKKQSLKKIKNKNKYRNKSKRHTFRKHKKLNLARKTLKKFRGGADEPIGVNIIEKPFNSGPNRLVQTAYIVDPDGNLKLAPVQVTNPPTTPVTGVVVNPLKGEVVQIGRVVNPLKDEVVQTGVASNPPTNPLSDTHSQISTKSPRETAVEVVDEIYKEMHGNEQQDPSKAVNEFTHKMAETLPSDAPQITGPNAVDQKNMQQLVVR